MTVSAKPLAGRHILLVEDDYLVATHLESSLKDHGAEVIGPASSVNEALHLIESTDRIDSAVLDITLNGETVFPVVDVLMERDVPFLFLTGHDKATIPGHYTDEAHHMKPVDNTGTAGTLTQIAAKFG